MAQKANTVNLVIQDANGQPQMIKVVQGPAANKQNLSQVQLNSNSIQAVFKVPGTSDGAPQAPVYRAVKVTGIKGGSKLVQVPIQTLTHLQKTTGTAQTPVQSGTPKKVQPQSSIVIKKEVIPQETPSAPSSKSSSTSSSSPTTSHSPRASASNSKTIMSPYLSRKRRDSDHDSAPEYTTKRRKAADKVGKGLRHFSMKVCEKVRTKGFTSYNEVADELVAEFAAGMHGSAESQQYDQKNIRRRVYDALNVLMAMNIISKEKKEIRWLGLPTNSVQECTSLERDKQVKLERIQKKTQQLHDLILQQISFKSLVERNRAAEARGVKPSGSSAIHLPFIVVNTSEKALIDCSISNDKTEYMFNFNQKFQIHDDIDILKRMGMLLGIDQGECTEENMEKAKSMVPKSLESYLEQMGRGAHLKISDLLEEDPTDEEDDEEEAEIDEEADGEPGAYSDDSNSDVDVN